MAARKWNDLLLMREVVPQTADKPRKRKNPFE